MRKFTVGLLCSTPLLTAHAYVECSVTPTGVHAGDNGNFYVFYQNGGAGAINQSDPDFKQTIALVTAALLTDRDLTVRYEDGYSCTAVFPAIIGLRLNR